MRRLKEAATKQVLPNGTNVTDPAHDVIEVQFRIHARVQPDRDPFSPMATSARKLRRGEGGRYAPGGRGAGRKQASAALRTRSHHNVPKDFVKPRFVVAGEVNRPGPYDLRGDIGLIEAIAISGGFK